MQKMLGQLSIFFVEKDKDEPEICLSMIDWFPDREMDFDSSSSDSDGELSFPFKLPR